MKKLIIIFFALILGINCKSQELNNNFEFGILGNIGFLQAGYTRSIVNFKNFSINTGTKIGWVPSSGDEKSSTEQKKSVPTFIHLNFPGEILWKFHKSNNVSVGFSYSKILVYNDKYSTRTKSNYNRILGEISYGHIIGWSNNDNTTTWIKVCFTPILYDNDANDVENIPIRLSFIYNF